MSQVKHNCGPSLMWAIPTLGRPVPLEWALNFKSMSPPINYNVDFSIIFGKEIGEARQAFAEQAIARGCKYLFFLGDDVVAPPHALRQLIYRMENNPQIDVVGGVYCAKAEPCAPLVFVGNGQGSYWDWKIGEFFECTGLGMDLTLIRTSVFEKMEKPWFKTVDLDGHLDGKNNLESWTEDLYFLDKVSKVGGRIFCDAAVIADHWDVYARKAYSLPKDSLPMRQKATTAQKKCLMVGPEIPMNEEYHVTRCTEANDPRADYRVQYDILPFEESQFDFVVVSEQFLDIERYMPEMARVCKPGCKAAFNINPKLDETYVRSLGKLNGTFVEIKVV